MRPLLALAALLLLAAPLALPGAAAPLPDPVAPLVVAQPGSWLSGFTNPVAVATLGGPLTLLNLDVMRHNVVAFETYGPDTNPWCDQFEQGRCPLFWSRLAGLGESVPVLGREQLSPLETYNYYCSTHPGPMRGVLLVLPDAG